jgi:repressor LexA
MKVDKLSSYDAFASKYDMGTSTLYELIRGRSPARGAWVLPSLSTLIKLARALNMPLHEVIYLADPTAPGAEEFAQQLSPPALRRVEVGTANWVGAGPEQTEFILDDILWVDEAWARGRDLVAFRVRGDSMANPLDPIRDGDIVIIDKNEENQPNKPVVAILKSGGYVCKLLKSDQHENSLMSTNPLQTNGTPSHIPISQVQEIVGAVVRVIHDI